MVGSCDNRHNIIIISDSSIKSKGLMKPQSQQQRPTVQAQMKSYSISQWILIVIRLVLIAILMCCVNIFHEWIRPRIIIPFIRRYLSCIVNLFFIRVVLLLLGFFKFQCQNYRYFDKMSRMMTFKSGWVGVASNRSIVQFLYYSYLFNPTYAKIIQYHEESKTKEQDRKVKLFYTPLTFRQAFLASLSPRGFDPIVIKGEAELKRFKRRKMQMPTLISECFQELNGPIMIFLPNTGPKEQIRTHKCLGQDIYDNQKRFLRSGVVFISQIEQFQSFRSQKRNSADFCTDVNMKPLQYLTEICSQLKLNILTITATQTIKYKYEYDRGTYSEFIDDIYTKSGYKMVSMEYEDYLIQLDSADEEARGKQEQEDLEMGREVLQEKEVKEDELGKLMELVEMEQHIKTSMIQEQRQIQQAQFAFGKID